MGKITHEIDKDNNIRLVAEGEANGPPYFYEAILEATTDERWVSHISNSRIDVYGIEVFFLKDLFFY